MVKKVSNQPPRRRVQRRRAGAKSIPRNIQTRMTPATCRALALSSPCAFADAVDAGRAVLQHARDASTAASTTVQLIRGVYQAKCDNLGNYGSLIAPMLGNGVCVFGTGAESTDQYFTLPGASGAMQMTSSYRVISCEIDISCNASAMNDGGNAYIGGLDPALAQGDYRSYALTTRATRVDALRALIDDRPKGTYSAFPVKANNKIVISRTNAAGWYATGDNTVHWVSHDGDSFIDPNMLGDTIWALQAQPKVKNFRAQDLFPVCGVAITGAPDLPFQIQVCLLIEVVPNTPMLSTTPGGAASAAGVRAIGTKIAANLPSGRTIENVEAGAEKVLEYGATALGMAGVPGASAAAEALHVGQAGINRLEAYFHGR